MTHTGRTRTLLQALARHPEGMTTPQLAQAIGEASLPWRRALNKAGIAMREHERLGRAVRAGTVPGQRGHAVIWQITPAGAAWLASRALTSLRDAQDAQEARIHARNLGVAADRMVQFHAGAPRPAREGRSPARTTAHLAVASLPAGL